MSKSDDCGCISNYTPSKDDINNYKGSKGKESTSNKKKKKVKSNKSKSNQSKSEENQIIDAVYDASSQIVKNITSDTNNTNIKIKTNNLVNPRLSYPHNYRKSIKTSRSLSPKTENRTSLNVYNPALSPRSGCQACRKRLWDPV